MKKVKIVLGLSDITVDPFFIKDIPLDFFILVKYDKRYATYFIENAQEKINENNKKPPSYLEVALSEPRIKLSL